MASRRPRPHGHLVIIGGAEEREGDMDVLRHVVSLTQDVDGPFFVLTAATEDPEGVWQTYRRGFRELGLKDVRHLHVAQRSDANDAKVYDGVREARGVFMTGGDQAQLIATVGGTQLCDHMRRAYIERGACIGGTSAGASAMSEHMLSSAESHRSPIDTGVELVAGLGFLAPAVIDQHFSQRGRLSRLLAAVAHNPKLVGIGIDEDTALVVARGRGIDVIGSGAVTLVDGRRMRSRVVERGEDERVFQATDLGLHLLPAGGGFIGCDDDSGVYSRDLCRLVELIASPDAVDVQFRDADDAG